MKYAELEGIGLTKSEILVYTALLRIGSSATGRIVKEAGISSGKIYEILDKLIEKGLVSYILKNNVKYFSASDPHKIKEYVEKQKREVEKKEEQINKLLPELEKLKKLKEEEYSAEILMGVGGFKTALMSVAEALPKNSEFLSLGGSGVRRTNINIIWKKTSRILNKKKIKARFIVTEISKESKKELQNYVREYPNFNHRFLPGFHLAPVIVGEDRTLIINFEHLSVIVIKSKTIAEQFRFFFESLWKIAAGPS